MDENYDECEYCEAIPDCPELCGETCPEDTTIPDDKPEYRSNGNKAVEVRPGVGQLELLEEDLIDPTYGGSGMAWGISRSYGNITGPLTGPANLLANRWYVQELATLDFVGASPGNSQPDRIVLRTTANGSLWFEKNSGTGNYEPLTTFHGSFQYDATAHEFHYMDESGIEWVFFDNDLSVDANQRGQLKNYLDAYGDSSQVTFDSNGRRELMRWDEETLYRYFYNAAGSISQVDREYYDVAIETVSYTHYGASDDHGSENDLKMAVVEEYDDFLMANRIVKRRYYRFYKDGDAKGGDHDLKFIIAGQTYDDLEEQGFDPLTMDDDDIKPYVDYYFEYDSEHRVTLQAIRGGADTGKDTTTYGYETNPDNPGIGDTNTWAVKTIITFPNDNERRIYTNPTASVLVSIYKDSTTDGEWAVSYKRNSTGWVTELATSAAVTTVTEPTATSTTLQANLNPTDGLIKLYDYWNADNPSQGEVKGYPSVRSVKEGSGHRQPRSRAVKTPLGHPHGERSQSSSSDGAADLSGSRNERQRCSG